MESNTDEDARRRSGAIYLVVFLFTIITEQFWFQYVLVDTEWHKPLFLSLAGGFFNLSFFLYAYWLHCASKKERIRQDLLELRVANQRVITVSHNGITSKMAIDDEVAPGKADTLDDYMNETVDFWTCVTMGIKSSPLYLSDIFLYALTLMHLTVPTAEIITSTSVVIAFIYGVMLKRERSSMRMIMFIAPMILSTIVVYSIRPRDPDTGLEADTFTGYIFGALSSIVVATLTVLMDYVSDPYMIGAQRVDELALFGGQAIGMMILSLPLLLIAHVTGFETFELPQGPLLYQVLILCAVVNPICLYSFGQAAMNLSPVVVQMTAVVAGPITVLIDAFLLGGHVYPIGYSLGMISMVGFSIAATCVIESERNITITNNKMKIIDSCSHYKRF